MTKYVSMLRQNYITGLNNDNNIQLINVAELNILQCVSVIFGKGYCSSIYGHIFAIELTNCR